ncbi:MAG: hypothetical protein HY451_01680 [Parcubacteria group bacterium]|nr:hypothetical protein [Parcubacteria group bacterium]
MNQKCSVVVSSFDGSSDVWEPFFTLFFRYWPDCPFPIHLVTNYLKYPDEIVETINIGEDKKWASNLKKALTEVNTPYILYLQEDYFLQKPIGTEYLLALLGYMEKNHVAYLRIFPHPGPDFDFQNEFDLGEISDSAPYRTSIQAAFWDKKVLMNLLVDGETGWDFEFKGAMRSRDYKFLSLKKAAFNYVSTTAIKKGKWRYPAVRLANKEGLKLDLLKRPVETWSEYYFGLLKKNFKKLARRIIRK